VSRYVHPDEFAELARVGRALGFAHVESGPLVRSSYHAKRQVEHVASLRATPAGGGAADGGAVGQGGG
jgi:lipoic acid synthetase